MVLSLILARWNNHQPLDSKGKLNKEAEEEEESLVEDRKIHPGVERDEEHLLDQDGGVDEDVGDAGADPDGNTGGGGAIQGEREPE